MQHDNNKLAGVTLLELMITVAIVGILAAIAYPSYTAYVLRSHRTDARVALMQDAQILEKSFTMNGNYSNSGLTLPHNSDNGFYKIEDKGVAATSYQLSATAIGSQQSDAHCAVFYINNTGIDKTKTTSPDCWNK